MFNQDRWEKAQIPTLHYTPASYRRKGEPVLQTPADEKSEALLVSFNWPLPSIRGQMFVCNPPPGFVVPKRPKNTIFQSCGRVYGNPPISDLLPRQELTAEHLEGYSPESRRILDKLGFYVDQPQESGYGPCIPIPLGVDKNSPFRHPNCKLGWGADPNSDEDNYQVYTSYSTSAPGETEESSEGADHREPSPEGVEGVQQTISQSDMELGELPLSLEDGGQPTVDELEEINLGTTDDPRPTFIAKALPDKEKAALKDLLGEFRDVFA